MARDRLLSLAPLQPEEIKMLEEKKIKFNFELADGFQYAVLSSHFPPIHSRFVNLLWRLTFHCSLESHCFESLQELAKAFDCNQRGIFRAIKWLLNKKVTIKVSENRYMINKNFEEWETVNLDCLVYIRHEVHLSINEAKSRQPATPSRNNPHNKKADNPLNSSDIFVTTTYDKNVRGLDTHEQTIPSEEVSSHAGLEFGHFCHRLQGADQVESRVEVTSNSVLNTACNTSVSEVVHGPVHISEKKVFENSDSEVFHTNQKAGTGKESEQGNPVTLFALSAILDLTNVIPDPLEIDTQEPKERESSAKEKEKVEMDKMYTQVLSAPEGHRRAFQKCFEGKYKDPELRRECANRLRSEEHRMRKDFEIASQNLDRNTAEVHEMSANLEQN